MMIHNQTYSLSPFFQFHSYDTMSWKMDPLKKQFTSVWYGFLGLEKEERDVKKLMLVFGEKYKEDSDEDIIQVLWMIVTFFAPKKDLGVFPDDLAFIFIDYVNSFRRSSLKAYYSDLWLVLFERRNFTDSVCLIYNETQMPISKDKENEYMQFLYKLL